MRTTNVVPTTEVIQLLHKEGYLANYDYIKWLVKNRYVRPPHKFGNAWAWTRSNIKELKNVLKKRGRTT